MSQRRSLPVTELKHVDKRYYPGVFGDFRENVENHIATLRANSTWENQEKARFFQYLLETVDHRAYGDLQQRYLEPPIAETGSIKYLDPVSWFEQKFSFAFRLGLHQKRRLRILDLGTGPGHFLVIAQFYGHHAIGTDLPDHADKSRPTHLYNALGQIYRTVRLKHRILPNEPLTAFPQRMDLVTAFSVAFNLAPRAVLWDKSTWDFFLRSLREHVLADDGALFMMMIRNKVRDEVWDYLASLADWHEESELLLFISKAFRNFAPNSGQGHST